MSRSLSANTERDVRVKMNADYLRLYRVSWTIEARGLAHVGGIHWATTENEYDRFLRGKHDEATAVHAELRCKVELVYFPRNKRKIAEFLNKHGVR